MYPTRLPPSMTTGSLSGKHALVCGASKGIGRAAAQKLAEAGAQVSVLARSQEPLAELVERLEDSGTAAHALVADLEDHDALRAIVETHVAAHGPIHILVNNAAGPPAGRLIDTPEDQLLPHYHRHLVAAHLLTRLLTPGMEEAGYGRIINILSTSVREPIPNLGVSNTLRAAMASWAKTLSRELPPGITINSVLPGFTDTERLSSLAQKNARDRGMMPSDIVDEWIAQTPEGRLGHPEELGAAVAFLASPAAAFIRGIVLPVDGGRLQSI